MGSPWIEQISKCLILGNFYDVKTLEAVSFFRSHFCFVVEALYGTQGDLLFGMKPVENKFSMRAQHPGNLLHRFKTVRPPFVTEFLTDDARAVNDFF